MKFILTSGGSGGSAGFGTGGPDASRDALSARFEAVLRELGPVERADHPIDGIRLARRARDAVHLCFALPHELPGEASAETIIVFGHGLVTCPERPFGGEMATDWRTRLGACGGAICLSTHAAQAVRALMGAAYPVRAICPPLAPRTVAAPRAGTLLLGGWLLDSAAWPDTGPPERTALPESDPDELAWPVAEQAAAPAPAPAAFRKTWRYRLGVLRLHAAYIYTEAFRDLLPGRVSRLISAAGRFALRSMRRLLRMPTADAQPMEPKGGAAHELPVQEEASFPAWQHGRHELRLGGIVFAAVQGGWDRSWTDLLSAFVMTCRDDEGATLAVKTAGLDDITRAGFASYLRRLGPFACRVVILDGSIEGGLDPLIAATHFILCASEAEAAPLGMMRFMAAGRPAVSPAHSALADFVSPETAFVAASGIEYEPWPGDVEQVLAATGARLDWASFCAGIAAARAIARQSDAYEALARGAAARLAELCAPGAASAQLAQFFAEAARRRRLPEQGRAEAGAAKPVAA